MQEFNISNQIVKNMNIVYIDHFDNINKNITTLSKNLSENTLVLSSHEINTNKNNKKYYGISYELFYIDSNKNIHRLSYNLQEGNGLILDSCRMYLGIDNNTIKKTSSYLYINNESLRYSYSNYPGVIVGDNNIYQDLFYDNNIYEKNGTISTSNGIVSLNSSIRIQFAEMEYYYKKCNNIIGNINNIKNQLDTSRDYKIGDVLYLTQDGHITPIAKGNIAYLVCIISSNMLEDTYPRFIPITYNTISEQVFSNVDTFEIDKTFNKVPVFTVPSSSITPITNIMGSSYGYIATNQENWQNDDHFYNVLNSQEKYFATTEEEVYDFNIKVYLDAAESNCIDLYSLNKESIISGVINGDYENTTLDSSFIIDWGDNFVGQYDVKLVYDKENKVFYNDKIIFPKAKERIFFDNSSSIHLCSRLNNSDCPPVENICGKDSLCTRVCLQLNLEDPTLESSSPYREDIEIPKNLQQYIKSDKEVNLKLPRELVYGQNQSVVKMAVHDDGTIHETDRDDNDVHCTWDENYWKFSNEMYYGCGGCGGCGSACGHCSNCSCDGYCSDCNNCPNNCPNKCWSFTPPIIENSSYVFVFTIPTDSNLSTLEYSYLKVYAADKQDDLDKVTPKQYIYQLNSDFQKTIENNYISENTQSGNAKVIAYANSNFLDKNPQTVQIIDTEDGGLLPDSTTKYYKVAKLSAPIHIDMNNILPIKITKNLDYEGNNEGLLKRFETQGIIVNSNDNYKPKIKYYCYKSKISSIDNTYKLLDGFIRIRYNTNYYSNNFTEDKYEISINIKTLTEEYNINNIQIQRSNDNQYLSLEKIIDNEIINIVSISIKSISNVGNTAQLTGFLFSEQGTISN